MGRPYKDKEKRNQTQRAWRKRNNHRYVYNRIFRQYNLSSDRYSELKAAGCSLCGNPFSKNPLRKEEMPNVDHDHRCCVARKSCGKCVRGLLCRVCNQQFIAAIEKNPALRILVNDRVLRYLDQRLLSV